MKQIAYLVGKYGFQLGTLIVGALLAEHYITNETGAWAMSGVGTIVSIAKVISPDANKKLVDKAIADAKK